MSASAAVDAVTKVFTPNPAVTVEATGKSLAITGSWGVQRYKPEEIPEICRKADTACVKVLYRVPEDKIACMWTVGFVTSGEKTTVEVLAEDENAAKYTLEKSPLKGQAQPKAVKRVSADYPPIARSAKEQGVVSVSVVVDASGTVRKVDVVDGPQLLRAAAVDAAKQWQFEPVAVGTRATSFRTQLSFNFSTAGTPGSSQTMAPGATPIGPVITTQGPVSGTSNATGQTFVSCSLAAGCLPSGPPQ